MKTASLLILLPTLGAWAAPLRSGHANALARVKRVGSDVDAIRDIFVVDDEKDHGTTTRVKRGAADVDAIRDIFVDDNPSSRPKAKRGNGDVDAIRDIFVVEEGATGAKPKRNNGEIDAIRDIFVVGDDGDDSIKGQDNKADSADAWIVHKNKRAAMKRGTGDVDAIRDIFLSTDNGDVQPNKLKVRHSNNPYADDVAAADPKAVLGEK